MSSYTLLVSGYRTDFSLVAFDSSTRDIKVLSDSPAPENASWVEPAAKKSIDGSRIVYSLSEAEKGKALSLVVKGDKVTVTSERDTLGGSCHVHIMKDGSGIVVANYLGGSLIYFPIEEDGTLSATSASPLLKFDLVYTEQGQTPPNPERQDASHCHQVIEGDDSILYVPDLGNDRVWVVWRGGESGLSVKGWCKHLYVLTELANTLLTFPLTDPTYPIIPHPDSGISIAPPSVPERYIKYLNAAELLAHPSLPVLYASNRLELDIGKASSGKFESREKGDAVAIATLSSDGTLEAVQHVRTGVDNIRAMQLSPDGKFVALAGQNGGGVEVYNVGQDGKTWELVAKNEAITK
ncbi:hypothetical protein B9479_002577 [Cryptococcus floricola]|uniref:Uncharacterized protein n=1 Tax=Cryptococcus floricola TaxID=2591691 RepID=A0A5D3AYS6_9TREE|nr:hypothetical protein B9479_002577 [Cryptococcus floricola]